MNNDEKIEDSGYQGVLSREELADKQMNRKGGVPFDNLASVRRAWQRGEFDYPGRIIVNGVPYNMSRSYRKSFIDLIKNGVHPYIVYTAPDLYKEKAAHAELEQAIVILWGTRDNIKLIPYDIRTVPINRAKTIYEQQETIGDVALLKIALPSGVVALKGKVDTGAEMSSLHVDGQPKVVGNMVRFANRNASQNFITAQLATQQAVKTADNGTEYRPVIELDVEMNGVRISKAMFNLNDRSKMEYPVLIGQNILEKTNFLVDPKKNVTENDEWLTEEEIEQLPDEHFDEMFTDIEDTTILEVHEMDKEQLYNTLEEELGDATLSDLLKVVRTKTLTRLDELK